MSGEVGEAAWHRSYLLSFLLLTAVTLGKVFGEEIWIYLVGCLSFPSSQWLSVIRHVAPVPSHYDVQDRFRIELSEEGTEGRVVGRKDITSVLRAPAYPLELQGHSEPKPNPGPPAWTGPTPARHLQESELNRFFVCVFVVMCMCIV